MIVGIVGQLLIVVVFFAVVRKVFLARHGGIHGANIRRVFQYLILFILIVIIGFGLTGLITQVLNASGSLTRDSVALARDTTFVVIGAPLFTFVAIWTRRAFKADESEKLAFTWRSYLLGTCLVSLTSAMFGLYDFLMWALGNENLNKGSLPRFIVWGAIFASHWILQQRTVTRELAIGHYILGSLVGLVIGITGLVQMLNRFFQWVLRTDSNRLISFGTESIIRGSIIFIIGIAIWLLYWVFHAVRLKNEPLWLAYVLLAGTAASIIMVVVSLSLALDRVLVWFIGDTYGSKEIDHFSNLPTYISATAVGIIVWIYHQSLLDSSLRVKRPEIVRIREYLLAAIGLATTGVGISLIIVSLIETLTSSTIVTGSSAINTLLAAGTLLISGIPLWWLYWSSAQRAAHRDPHGESQSQTRKIYLLLLFGLMGITAIVSLLVACFLFFQDLFQGNFGLASLNRVRVPLSILVTAAAVSLYHWQVRREVQIS